MTYLDWNATAPLRPEAAAAAAAALQLCGNPSSVHRGGRAARRVVEDARDAVARLLDAAPDMVVFTSGGTEANHLALRGSGRRRVLVSAVEHDSVLQAVADAERIPVDGNGIVRLDRLDAMLAAGSLPALVSVMIANNETGIIQPSLAVAEVAHGHDALYHCDAVQAVGKLPCSLAATGADLLTLSAHKIGGPQGVGALVVRDGVGLDPQLRGGQEHGRRAGTENVPGIAGFGAAAGVADDWRPVEALRDRLESEIAARAPDALVIGAAVARLPNTTALAMPGMPAETQVIALDLDGVMVSAGAACSSGKVRASHVLAAMGYGPDIAGATIRISLGWTTKEADIDRFLDAWTALYRRRRPAVEARAA
jgi:cysteine desulfurase